MNPHHVHALSLSPVNKSLVLVSNDLDMALVEAKHLCHAMLAYAHPKRYSPGTYLLRALSVNDFDVVLGLLVVLPDQVDN